MLRCSTTGWLPNDLLMGGAVPPDIRAESQAILESCCSVEIPQYSRQEMENCLSYYSERKWVNKGQDRLYVASPIMCVCVCVCV